MRSADFQLEPDALVKLMSTTAKGDGVTYEQDEQDGLRARSEQAIGELAQALIDNPTLHNAISAAFGAREKAIEAQQAAMSALNLPRRPTSSGSSAACARFRSAWRTSRSRSTTSAARSARLRRESAKQRNRPKKAKD